jgi:hypothetical protein
MLEGQVKFETRNQEETEKFLKENNVVIAEEDPPMPRDMLCDLFLLGIIPKGTHDAGCMVKRGVRSTSDKLRQKCCILRKRNSRDR